VGEADRIGSNRPSLALSCGGNTLRKALTPYSVRCSVRSIPISPAWSLFLLGAGLNLDISLSLGAAEESHDSYR